MRKAKAQSGFGIFTPEPVKGTYVQHLSLQRGHVKGRNRRSTTDRSGSTEHEPPGFFTTMELRIASEPKKIWFK